MARAIHYRANPNDGLDIVLIVTDHFSHRQRRLYLGVDYNLNPLADIITGKTAKNPIFIFDSSPTAVTNIVPASHSLTHPPKSPSYASGPSAQWNYLRNGLKGKALGQNLGFPLNSSSFASVLPNYIKNYKTQTCN